MVQHRLPTKQTLVTALLTWSERTRRARARRFLTGLSFDELEFIAEFLGACILEAAEDFGQASRQVQAHQARMARASLRRTDHELKMIVLREYLAHTGRKLPLSAGVPTE